MRPTAQNVAGRTERSHLPETGAARSTAGGAWVAAEPSDDVEAGDAEPSWHRRVHRYRRVDSTMHVARRLAMGGSRARAEGTCPAPLGLDPALQDIAAEPAPEGTTVVAATQTAGRGRRGRRWESPTHAGLWMTTVLRPQGPPVAFGELALVAGAAVLEAVQGLLPAGAAAQVGLKWPNDVLVGPRKLAGILLEAEELHSEHPYVLVGIGINVAAAAQVPELPATMASRYVGLGDLSAAATADPETACAQLLDATLMALATHYRRWQRQGLGPALGRWRDADVLRGQMVRVQAPDGTLVGRAAGLSAAGRLNVETAAGTIQVLAGEVERVEAE